MVSSPALGLVYLHPGLTVFACKGMGLTLSSVAICEELDQLFCSRLLQAGLPFPLSPGPAPLLFPGEVQDLLSHDLQLLRVGIALLSS